LAPIFGQRRRTPTQFSIIGKDILKLWASGTALSDGPK